MPNSGNQPHGQASAFMFDSIRTRLTLLHIAILATVLVGFAAAAYLLTLRELDRDLDGRLEEMSRSFTAALEAESADDEHDDTPSHIISQTVQNLISAITNS